MNDQLTTTQNIESDSSHLAIIEIIKHNNLKMLKKFLSENISISFILENYEEYINLAIDKECKSIKTYLEKEYGDQYLREKIFNICKDGNLEELEKMEDIDLTFESNLPLRIASGYGHLDIVKYLVEQRKVSIHDCKNGAVRFAAKNGRLEVVKYLIEQGADVIHNNSRDLAYNYGNFEVAKFLDEYIRDNS